MTEITHEKLYKKLDEHQQENARGHSDIYSRIDGIKNWIIATGLIVGGSALVMAFSTVRGMTEVSTKQASLEHRLDVSDAEDKRLLIRIDDAQDDSQDRMINHESRLHRQ